MKNLKPLFVTLIVIEALLLVGCRGGEKSREPSTQTLWAVSVETAELQAIPENYEAVGTIRSATSSVLSAQLNGTVREIRVKTGDRVRKGQLLALLDDRSPHAQLGAAEAGVEESTQGLAEVDHALEAAAADRHFAEVTYRRYQELLNRNSVSRQEFDGAEAKYKAALAQEAALAARKKQMEARGQQAMSQQDSAQTLLSYSRIVSPIDGVVTAKSVDAGTVVMPGTPILTVEDTTQYRLEASLPERLLAKVRLGQATMVETDEGKLEGRVAEIVPAADAASRTFVAKVQLPRNCACRSGEYGKAGFPVGAEKRLLVPRSAIVEQGQIEGLFVISPQGVAQYRLVKTGKSYGGRVEVLSGLAEGERVAISQADQLTDGTRVEIR